MKTKTIVLAVLIGSIAATGVLAKGGHKGGMRAALPAFEELDSNGDGQVTLAEITAHRESAQAARFAEADTDASGTLSAEEMVAMASKKAGDRAAKRADRMIERLDTNEDGALSLEELQAARSDRGDRGERGQRMFDRADANDDGVLTQDEFDAAKARMEERKAKRKDRG